MKLTNVWLCAAIAALCALANGPVAYAHPSPCGGIVTTCPSPTPDQITGQFHGLIGLTDDASLIDSEGDLGTEPGCGDCVWTVVEDCPTNTAGNPVPEDCTAAHNDPACKKRQIAERFFLSTKQTDYQDEGVYCIGDGNHVVPVGDDALADVERYLKDVTPPDLDITFDPGTSLAGLATKVTAAPPDSLKPQPFGGNDVTETITLHAAEEDWNWGDGTTDHLVADSQGLTHDQHTFANGGHLTSSVTTTWGATYTITYQGQTFGPYDATGTLTKTQSANITILTSDPVLISHG